MEDDLKKNWWIIVAIALVVLVGTAVATPVATKYKNQTTGINSASWTAPTP
jgi:capsular polysaccharide biosynthesis protein